MYPRTIAFSTTRVTTNINLNIHCLKEDSHSHSQESRNR